MKNEFVKMELAPIAPRWWALVIRGLAAIAFGVVALVRPGAGLLALVVLWGASAIVDGVFSIVLAIGIYAILFGALLIGLGVRLHRFVEMVEHPAHA